MATSHFRRMLTAKVMEVLEARVEQVTKGVPVDYAGYREEVGYIKGLRDALVLAEDLEREPDERSNSG